MRILVPVLLGLAAVGTDVLAIGVGPWWWFAAGVFALLTATACYDLGQREHSVLRNYPVIGHARFLMEFIRPEIQQYFIERNHDGRPFDRDVRSVVYQRSKGTLAEEPFGTERDTYADGYEYLTHSMCPAPRLEDPITVRVGGPDCTKPYDMSLLNVSAMSFGALSSNAILALGHGAQRGGFAHDTGEGGLSEYHRRTGADLIWELGTGYFGCRTRDGDFDPVRFEDTAAHETVRSARR